MKRLLPLVMVFGVFLLSSGCQTTQTSTINLSGGVDGGNLMPCPGNYDKIGWHWCNGTITWNDSDTYPRSQQTLTHLHC